MQGPNASGQSAAHDQPHDYLRALPAAAAGVLGKRDLRQLLGIVLDQIEKLLVPFRVVEPGTFTVDLVRESAGRDDDDVQILRIALDGSPQ
jgi:hypothetical protein